MRARLILVPFFLLLLAGRLLNAIFRRDPLRLREPAAASLWIERPAVEDVSGYFSEASPAEGRGNGGFGFIGARALRAAAGLFAPSRGKKRAAGYQRSGDIPDEVYTLW